MLDITTGEKCCDKLYSRVLTDITQGLPQYIQLAFDSGVVPHSISFTFQGGFVGSQCDILVASSETSNPTESDWTQLCQVFPEDVNRVQVFELAPLPESLASIHHMKLAFRESTDFFGRITIYDLKLSGVFKP
jgi:hypothetical protein